MILRLFRNIDDYRWFAAVFVLLVLFIPFNYVIELPGIEHHLLNYLIGDNLFIVGSGVFLKLLTIMIIVITAAFFQGMLVDFKIIPSRNYTGLFFGVLFFVIWHPTLPLLTDILSAGLLLLSLFNIFTSEESERPNMRMFDAYFLLSLATIVNFAVVIYLFIPVIAMLILRHYTIRIWVAAFVGLLLPYLFLFMYDYVSNDSQIFPVLLSDITNGFNLTLSQINDNKVLNGVFLSLTIFSMLFALSKLKEKKIHIRKKTIILMWIVLFSMVLLFVNIGSVGFSICLISFILGFLFSFAFSKLLEKRLVSVLTDVGVIVIVVWQILNGTL